MSTFTENIVENTAALSLCLSCNKWQAHKEEEVTGRICTHCFNKRVFKADHKYWAYWFNPSRGFVNLPTGDSVRIPFDSPEHTVLTALRAKYLAL